MNLINYNGWELPLEMGSGRYRNTIRNGILEGLWKKEYKNGNAEMLVLTHGYQQRKYKYPNIEIPFKHPMVNWENLFLCGGFQVRDELGNNISTSERIVAEVIEGRKPIGFAHIPEHEIVANIEAAKMYDLSFAVAEHHWDGYSKLCLAQKGKVGELFDLEAVWDSYLALQQASGYMFFREREHQQLMALADKELSEFLLGWDYANPETTFEIMKTGLLLGYAIESTFAILME